MQNMDENQGSKEEDLKGKIWEENKKMWVVAGPAIFTRFSTFGITVISQAFIGHIGPTELAAFALVATLLARFANGLLLGAASGLETLCGQAYGAKQYHMLGIYLQRSWIVLIVVTTTVLVPIYIFAAPILKALGQDEVIAKVAGNIALCVFVIIPRFPVLASNSEVQIRSERHFDINNFGILGSKRGAINIRHIWRMSRNMERFHNLSLQRSLAGCQAFFIVWCYDLVWPTPPEMSFHEFIDLASLILILLTITCNVTNSLGNLKNAEVELDALSICLNINGWEMMISFGFMAAASVRVSNELGKGDSKAAKFSIVNIVLTSFSIGFVLHSLVTSSGVFILLNSIQPVLSGVAVGAGRQSAVVYVNLGSYYLIGIPTGVLLGYVIKLQVEGVWIGMLIGTCIQTIILMILTKRTDWEKQVSVARTRVNKWFVETEPTHNSAAASSQILNSISKECYMFLIFPAKVSYTSLVYVKCDMDYDVDS
ncbi:UNVERIFIED_CONTAM: protein DETOXIFICATION 21 [Sesamum latifolium]|uniref:Protein DETOXIFICATION n=1 Tax=Sesamum latifolium TaxID=2727402 RepID=A0AAW2XH89_9LAMI